MAHKLDRDMPMKPVVFETGKAFHKGMVRKLNEDSVVTLELSLGEGSEGMFIRLYAVADGIGGHEGGIPRGPLCSAGFDSPVLPIKFADICFIKLMLKAVQS